MSASYVKALQKNTHSSLLQTHLLEPDLPQKSSQSKQIQLSESIFDASKHNEYWDVLGGLSYSEGH
jgi:hypothetical protein